MTLNGVMAELLSVAWLKRVKKFEDKFHACTNLLCKIT